jgi:hypothetical protein
MHFETWFAYPTWPWLTWQLVIRRTPTWPAGEHFTRTFVTQPALQQYGQSLSSTHFFQFVLWKVSAHFWRAFRQKSIKYRHKRNCGWKTKQTRGNPRKSLVKTDQRAECITRNFSNTKQ